MTDILRNPFAYQEREEAKEKAARDAKREADEFVDSLKKVMRTTDGRRVLRWVLEESALFSSSFKESAQRATYMALATAHDEGRKHTGRKLFLMLQAVCPELYVRMIKEKEDGRNE